MAGGIREINRLSIWIFGMIFLLIMAMFGTYSIVIWIKEGKI